MVRIEPLEAPYSSEVQASFDRLMPEGMAPLALFRTVAHNPRVLRRMQRGGLLDPGSISVRLRELMILRTCARCDARYEWGVHAAIFADAAQLDAEELKATVHHGPAWPGWSDKERAILELADALHDRAEIDPEQEARLAKLFDPAQRIELAMLAGLYHAVSYVVNVTGVADEAWAPPWPASATEDAQS